MLQADLQGAVDDVDQCLDTLPVAVGAGQAAGGGPAAVAVHDDRDVAGHGLGGQLGRAGAGGVGRRGDDRLPPGGGRARLLGPFGRLRRCGFRRTGLDGEGEQAPGQRGPRPGGQQQAQPGAAWQGRAAVQQCGGGIGRHLQAQPVQVGVGGERDADRRVQHRRPCRAVQPGAGLVGQAAHQVLELRRGAPGQQVRPAHPGLLQNVLRQRHVATVEVVGEVDEGVREVDRLDGGLPGHGQVRHARGDRLRLGGQARGPQQQRARAQHERGVDQAVVTPPLLPGGELPSPDVLAQLLEQRVQESRRQVPGQHGVDQCLPYRVAAASFAQVRVERRDPRLQPPGPLRVRLADGSGRVGQVVHGPDGAVQRPGGGPQRRWQQQRDGVLDLARRAGGAAAGLVAAAQGRVVDTAAPVDAGGGQGGRTHLTPPLPGSKVLAGGPRPGPGRCRRR